MLVGINVTRNEVTFREVLKKDIQYFNYVEKKCPTAKDHLHSQIHQNETEVCKCIFGVQVLRDAFCESFYNTVHAKCISSKGESRMEAVSLSL